LGAPHDERRAIDKKLPRIAGFAELDIAERIGEQQEK
jgi:hypothetical protein